MDREQTLRLWKQAADESIGKDHMSFLDRFAALVAAAVKEEDAKICDCYAVDDCGKNDDAKRCAAAIRASIKEGK